MTQHKKGRYDAETTFRIGARGSQLSRWQAAFVEKLLKKKYAKHCFESVFITTKGDKILDKPLSKIGSKGLFTFEIEEALRAGKIDFAVHSQKDLPVEEAEGIAIGAVLKRENPSDVLISRKGYTLETLPINAKVGTSSLRRKAQLLFARNDLSILDIRGNVDTRLDKALEADGPYDAIVLAYAGIKRLKREDVISEMLGFDFMLPCPGQGALAVQCSSTGSLAEILTPIHDEKTFLATLAERSYLQGLGGGCSVPVAAFAEIRRKAITLAAAVIAPDGSEKHLLQSTIDLPDDIALARKAVTDLGNKLARIALEDGALAMMEKGL